MFSSIQRRALVRCLHCGAANTEQQSLADGSFRYLCRGCGPYRVSAPTEAAVAEPAPGETQGAFVMDGAQVRWFVAD